MVQRFMAATIALFALPIAAGAVFEERPSPLPELGAAFAQGPQALRGSDVPAAYAVTQEVGSLRHVERSDLASPNDTSPARATAADAPGTCPGGMAAVEGEYCTEVRHTCKRWLDDEKLQYARCAEYEKSARCVGQRVKMSYCIDRYEYTRPGEDVPMNHASFVVASKTCKDLGKRICTENEWNFACEGEEMRPYPYGWTREPKCNQDREDLYEQTPKKMLLKDHREASNARPECTSPFGVYNMVGNVDEPVLREIAQHNHPFRNGLKGGWWMAGRNRCRPATTAHDDYYEDIQVGVRCCSDSPGGTSAPAG